MTDITKQLADALKYAKRFLGPEDVDMPYIDQALAAYRKMKAPTPELEGSEPLVLYFGNDADREEFIEAAKHFYPNMTTKKL